MNDALIFDLTFPVEPGTCVLETSDSKCERHLRTRDNHLLIFVSQGSAALTSCSARHTLQLTSGQALVAEPGERINLETPKDTEYYLLTFGPAGGLEVSNARLDLPTTANVTRPERLTYLLRRYLLVRERGGRSPQVLCGLLLLILREIALSSAAADGNGDEAKGAESIASRVDAYIAAHYREQIGTPDIAMELRYNPEYLERAYRQQRQLSIRDAIHTRRVREAGAQLLLHRERCVSDIARMCGYHDASYFRRVFKRTTNMTPNRFRFVHALSREGGGGKKVTNVSA